MNSSSKIGATQQQVRQGLVSCKESYARREIIFQVEEVVVVMRDNIDKVLERGWFNDTCVCTFLNSDCLVDGKLSNLESRASNLEDASRNFQVSARNVKKKMWWQDMKMKLIIGGIITVIVIVITTVIIVETTGGSGNSNDNNTEQRPE